MPPTVTGTPANAHDITQAHALLHGQESEVFGDSGYTGVEKREENRGCSARWNVAMKPGRRRALPASKLGTLIGEFEHVKARIRAKVEHPFRVLKRQFGYSKVRYRGLVKNTAQIITLFALSNLWMARHQLAMTAVEVRP